MKMFKIIESIATYKYEAELYETTIGTTKKKLLSMDMGYWKRCCVIFSVFGQDWNHGNWTKDRCNCIDTSHSC